jgi:hypothetical protein
MVSADMQLVSLADLPLRELLSQVNAG